MADFTAWYGLDDLDDLDEEYAAVKELIELDKVPAEKMCITLDGQTPVSKTPKEWMGEENYRCFSTFY
jgi:hypothetical protein